MNSPAAGASAHAANGVVLAEVTRGPLVESQHLGHIAVASASRDLIASLGQAEARIFLRSAAKPIQALVPIQAGVVEAYGLEPRHVAVMCGSHTGLERHTTAVLEILERVGLGPEALRCGADAPANADAARALAAAGQQPSPLHNNCSGKHAGMLAACRRLELDREEYLSPSHPLQQRILAVVSALAGLAAEDIAIGVDGCGVPTFGIPLVHAAIAFARLATPQQECRSEDNLAAAARTVIAVMAAHPDMVSEPGSFNTELLAALGPNITAKGGAEGVFCLGLAPRGVGVAVKIADGSNRALPAVVLAVLRQLEAIPDEASQALKGFLTPEIRNCHGDVVGQVRPTVERFL